MTSKNKNIFQLIIFNVVLFLGVSAFSESPLKLVTSTTDLAWAAQEIGGPLVEVQSLLKGTENPHYIDAVPEYIRLVAEAAVVCVVGLDLEIGWIPKVLARSGNAQVQPGGKGYCETGKGIAILEKPQGAIDRSMGDVHPSGNPHFWLSPTALAQGARVIAETLIGVDPAHMSEYQAGLKALTQKLDAMKNTHAARLKAAVPDAATATVMEYHREFAYLFDAYGLRSFGSVEEKPGIQPSAGRLAEVGLAAKGAGIRFVLAADTAPKKTLAQFSELSGLAVIQVPMSVQPGGKVRDYAAFQEQLIDSVIRGFQSGRKTASN